MSLKFNRSQLLGTKMGEQLSLGSSQENRKAKLQASRKQTTDLTRWCINYMNDTGEFKVWRNNNIPSTRTEIITRKDKVEIGPGIFQEVDVKDVKHHFKKNQKEVSTLDIIGYRISDGLHLELDVKRAKDTLDKDQASHMQAMQKAGCISFSITDKETFKVQIKQYMKPRTLAF